MSGVAALVRQYFGLCRHCCFLVNVPDTRGIFAEHFATDFRSDLRISVAFDKLIGDLEIAERLDLPLGVAPQQRVGAPQHIIWSQISEQCAEYVRTFQRAAGYG